MTRKSISCHLIVAATILGLAMVAGPVGAIPPPHLVDSAQAAMEAAANGRTTPTTQSAAQASEAGDYQFCLLDEVQFTNFGGSDIWGWQHPDGREYAFMGVFEGIAVYNVTDQVLVETVIGPQNNCGGSFWRDFKNYQNYLYAVTECTGTNQGIIILDLSTLPNSVTFVDRFATSFNNNTHHNVSIDTVQGYLYAVNPPDNGVRVWSLADPENPQLIGDIFTGDCHDMFAHNDTLYVAEGNNSSWSIWDVSDKLNPVEIVNVIIPNSGYVHNVWPTADRRYAGTTEETVGKTVKIWDIQDLQNIQLVGEYPAVNSLAHNIHFENGRGYISSYSAGVVILDISDPNNPVESDRFDTFTANDNPAFDGCWGIYPHTATGKIYASNDDGRLFIFQEVLIADGDTLRAGFETVEPASLVSIDINLTNANSVNEIVLPIDWNGPFNLLFDSVSVAGTRADGFTLALIADGRASGRVVYDLLGNGLEIPPGDGPIARAHFRFPGGTPAGDTNVVRVDAALLQTAKIANDCFSVNLPSVAGAFVLPPDPATCCVGTTGNVDFDGGDTVGLPDLSALIDHLFISFAPLSCPDEGDINADGDVGLPDLSALIDNLFITFTPLPNCP